jgi:hypothetical protein
MLLTATRSARLRQSNGLPGSRTLGAGFPLHGGGRRRLFGSASGALGDAALGEEALHLGGVEEQFVR